MDAFVLDLDMKVIRIIDNFQSLIWTERYSKYGDFEIYMAADDDVINSIAQDYYIWVKESERVMIIEKIEIETNTESGNYLTISGRSLESLLMRRIVWDQTIFYGNLEAGIKTLITQNIISPTNSNRKIDNFIFRDSEDEAVTSISINSAQFTGTTLYEAIKGLCDSYGLGFKITLNNANQFVFSLYSGVDHSYDQNTNPYVVFSPSFENIVNSDYINTTENYCTVAEVAGEGEGSERRKIEVGDTSITGVLRRELFVDARDISSSTDDGTLSDEDYENQLSERGISKLAETLVTSSFDGEVDTKNLFRYGENFGMGDLVQIVNEFGMSKKVRVVEFIQSEDVKGYTSYPTFDDADTSTYSA